MIVDLLTIHLTESIAANIYNLSEKKVYKKIALVIVDSLILTGMPNVPLKIQMIYRRLPNTCTMNIMMEF